MPTIALCELDARTARQNRALKFWRMSRMHNHFCKTAIRNLFRVQFEDEAQRTEAVNKLLEDFGIDRMQWVLAFSIQANREHFNEAAQKWASTIVPENYPMAEAQSWIIPDHFAQTADLAEQMARQYAGLHLVDASKCESSLEEQDVTGRLLILNPRVLADNCKIPHAQYFYVTNSPEHSRTVKGYHLMNGQREEFRRSDMLGIADENKLPAWADKRLAEIRAPQMEIRIFQIDRDKDSKQLSFRSYAETMQKGGVDASIYHQVYGGTFNCSSLEDVYALCNSGHPPGYYGHSLSVSDVIEVCSGDQKGFYFCDSFGFKQIDFDIGQTDHDKMLRALIVECGKEPYIGEIQDCLRAKQSVVGGLIEAIYFDRTNRALVYCDEEFLLKGCEPNRYVGNCLVHSTFMVIGNGQNEYGEGIEVSLTDKQIAKFAEQFRYPVIYDPAYSTQQTEEEAEDFSFSQA